jgi:uncharacterized membrane protein YkvI
VKISKDNRLSLQIAATFVGTIVGAGFATGKEIVQFFTQYGAWGTCGVLISGLLLIWVGTKIMIFASNVKARSYKDLNVHLFGPILGGVFNSLVFIVLLGVTAVMLSGAGAVFHEQVGWPFQVGLLITIALCYVSLLKGLNGLMMVNSIVVPLMILFTLLIALFRLPFLDTRTLFPTANLQSMNFHWLISAFSYVSFNLLTAQAVLVPLGGEIRNHKIIRRGGILGGLILTLLLLAGHIALKGSPTAVSFQIPMAEIIKALGPVIHLLFVMVIFGEIFTTFIGNIYGLRRHLAQVLKMKEHYIMVLLLSGIYLISQIGYGPLLTHLYPFFGYLGLLFMFYILMKK